MHRAFQVRASTYMGQPAIGLMATAHLCDAQRTACWLGDEKRRSLLGLGLGAMILGRDSPHISNTTHQQQSLPSLPPDKQRTFHDRHSCNHSPQATATKAPHHNAMQRPCRRPGHVSACNCRVVPGTSRCPGQGLNQRLLTLLWRAPASIAWACSRRWAPPLRQGSSSLPAARCVGGGTQLGVEFRVLRAGDSKLRAGAAWDIVHAQQHSPGSVSTRPCAAAASVSTAHPGLVGGRGVATPS